MSVPSLATPSRRRRWFSLSLRGMMLLILVAGGLMGWKARRVGLQKRAVAAIERLRGSVVYDWEYQGLSPFKMSGSNPPGPIWLRRILGDEYFQEVAAVILPTDLPTPPSDDEDIASYASKYEQPLIDDQLACVDGLDRVEALRLQWGRLNREGLERLAQQVLLKDLTLIVEPIDAAGLARLGRLTELESLCVVARGGDADDLAFLDRLPKLRKLQILDGPVTDAGMARIARRNRLESLHVDGSKLTEPGLAQLEGLTELVILDLERTAVTEAGLESLRKLPKLMMLEIPKGQISDAAIDKFKAARPGVTLSIVP
jgi:hypothetical protein